MNPAEEIVKFWLQANKSFMQSSIRLPYNREIDILAIDKNGDKSHIEVSVSVRMANYTRNAKQLAQYFYDKKFHPVEQEVKNRIGENYKKKLVVGKVARGNADISSEFIQECKSLNVKIILFQNILNEIRPLLLTNSHLNPIIKSVQLTEVFEKNSK